MHFGKYEVLSEIARGGMGVLYKARDPFIDRILAVKTLLPEIEVEEQLKRRMIVEARAAGNLHHPNIVTIYDLGVIDGRPYIAMEYLEGMDLSRVIRKHPRVLLQNKLRIVATVAEALDFAHRRNIVHRDIKPPNIFVLSSGLLKVVDFGIARVSDATLTSTGQILGTLAYMSPEQLSGKQVDRRSDVFSLGVVFYELLARTRPFNAPEAPVLIGQILEKKPPPPCPGLPPALAARLTPILDRALAKDPAERYPNAAELAADIRRLLGEVRWVEVDAENVNELHSRLERAESLLAARELEDSVAAIRDALEIDPTDERALGLSERIEEDRFRHQVKGELTRIHDLVERNELKNARSALRQILRRDSSLHDARELLDQVEARLKEAGELERDQSRILSSLPAIVSPDTGPLADPDATGTVGLPGTDPTGRSRPRSEPRVTGVSRSDGAGSARPRGGTEITARFSVEPGAAAARPASGPAWVRNLDERPEDEPGAGTSRAPAARAAGGGSASRRWLPYVLVGVGAGAAVGSPGTELEFAL